jgi:hypothetical protein
METAFFLPKTPFIYPLFADGNCRQTLVQAGQQIGAIGRSILKNGHNLRFQRVGALWRWTGLLDGFSGLRLRFFLSFHPVAGGGNFAGQWEVKKS